MDPRLTHVFTLRAHVAQDSVQLGSNPTGSQKNITALEGGIFHGVPNTRGEGVDATLVPGGSDWVLFDPATNVVQIDVRTQGKLSDGSGLSLQYTGYMMVDEQAKRFMAPQFKWTESTVFVGRGRCCFEDGQQMVEY
ncbi:hypothetical protein PENSUB_13273 [Penicillium subrubescens]|uniref:Uncharacterized protein n=1 Tax=Penicillium subrubescens TaxID=1316194 RepID=A0A1Q5SRK2_9EURO|nr:hypothetical protein PENSUB_13273 [Penicillium subrubescens]